MMESEPTVKWKKLKAHSWRWEVRCEGELVAGSVERTKRDAKNAAIRVKNEIVCNSVSNGGQGDEGENKQIDVTIIPPDVSASIFGGYLESFEISNPCIGNENNEVSFPSLHFNVNDISENALAWLVGLCFFNKDEIERHELLIAQLKVWELYRGGNSEEEIKNLHNLDDAQVDLILSKLWSEVTVFITEENNENGNTHETFQWNFEE